MSAALALLLKLLPLYVTVALGWIAGRFLEASGRHIAGIMLYIVTPSVVFSGVMAAPLSPEVILLPFLVFGTSSVLGLVQLKLAKKALSDGSANTDNIKPQPLFPEQKQCDWHPEVTGVPILPQGGGIASRMHCGGCLSCLRCMPFWQRWS